MLQTKFHGNRPVGSSEDFEGFSPYGHGGHFGHVTSISTVNFHFHVPNSLPTKFG